MNRVVTIRDVARLCKCSPSTVTQVLGHGAHLFREETRQRVLKAAQHLGYRPNAPARAMRYGRLGNIGLLQSTHDGRSTLFSGLLDGIHDGLADQKLRLMISRLCDAHLNDRNFVPTILCELSCDGLLINYNSNIPSHMLQMIEDCQIPSIWINSRGKYDHIHPDDQQAGFDAAQYLLQLGHRRIAYVSYSSTQHYSDADRRQGYQSAMHKAGLAPQVIQADIAAAIPRSKRVEYSSRWLRNDDRPTAVITYAPSTALPIIRAAEVTLRLCVPQDLSVITFDEHAADVSGLPLETWIVPEYGLGRRAVNMLMRKLSNTTQRIRSGTVSLIHQRGQSCAPRRC